MIGDSGTTIELSLDAKASLAKEMKGKGYDLEGVDSLLTEIEKSYVNSLT